MLNQNQWDVRLSPLKMSAREYVRQFAARKTDAILAEEISKAGMPCTSDAVRGVRRRGNVSKPVAVNNLPAEASATAVQRGNSLELESHDQRIKTLEQLIVACQIDLAEWEIEKHVINKWEVGAKGDAGFNVEPLFQVKAWLVKRKPVALEPVVSPVSLRISTPPRKTQKHSQIKRALILPDPQFGFRKELHTGKLDPFHDRHALDIAVQIATDYEIEQVVWLGDIVDLPDWSDKFVRSPEYYWTTQPAIIEAAWWLGQVRQATPNAKTVMLFGNHDDRLERSVKTHMIQAYDLRPANALAAPPALSIPNLLGLSQLNIDYIADYPNGEFWISPQVRCVHGDVARSNSGATVSSQIDDAQATMIQGHAHRIESAYKTLYAHNGQRTVSAWSMGCLCRVDGVVPGVKARQNWQQAIGVVEYTETHHHVTAVPINHGTALFQGEVYSARDRLADLRRDTGWEF